MEEFLLILLIFIVAILLLANLGTLITGEGKILTKTFIGLSVSFVIGILIGLVISAIIH